MSLVVNVKLFTPNTNSLTLKSSHLSTLVSRVWYIYDFLSQVWLVSLLHLASAWARWERRPDSWLTSSASSMRLWWNLSSWSCGWYHLRISLTHLKKKKKKKKNFIWSLRVRNNCKCRVISQVISTFLKDLWSFNAKWNLCSNKFFVVFVQS